MLNINKSMTYSKIIRKSMTYSKNIRKGTRNTEKELQWQFQFLEDS